MVSPQLDLFAPTEPPCVGKCDWACPACRVGHIAELRKKVWELNCDGPEEAKEGGDPISPAGK